MIPGSFCFRRYSYDAPAKIEGTNTMNFFDRAIGNERKGRKEEKETKAAAAAEVATVSDSF